MKDYMKRFKYASVLIISIILINCSNSIAADLNALVLYPDSFAVSEYDIIINLRNQSDEVLQRLGYTSEEIYMVKSNYIESELLSRQMLSDDVLKIYYGYTDDAIEILKKYDGSPIEKVPAIRAISATLTISRPVVISSATSTTGVAMKFTWTWNQCPLITFKDCIAITWVPTFSNGQSGNLRYYSNGSYHKVTYTDGLTSTTRDYAFSATAPTFGIKQNFTATITGGLWAKKGTAVTYYKTTAGSGNLSETDFLIQYAHTVLNITPSVSFPYAGSISIGLGTQLSGSRSGYITTSSKIWVDN